MTEYGKGETMKLQWLRPFIVLVAALIVMINNIASKRPMLEALVVLLVVIVIFFLIGTIGTALIEYVIQKGNEEAAETETQEQDMTSDLEEPSSDSEPDET